MDASKTGFPAFEKDGETVYAGQITAIEMFDHPLLGKCPRLWFGKRKAEFHPDFLLTNCPEVGGYFVVRDEGLPFCMSAKDFKYGEVR